MISLLRIEKGQIGSVFDLKNRIKWAFLKGEKMNHDELKQTIENQTGIPVNILSGETDDEIINYAKNLIALKNDFDSKRTKSAREQFSEMMTFETSDQNAILEEIREQSRIDSGGYPRLHDGGCVNVNVGDHRTPREQFAKWADKKMSYDPLMRPGGWKPLIR